MTKRNIKAKTAPKATARKATTVSAYAHWPEGKSAYAGVTGPVRGLIICAAFVAAGYAKLNKANIGKDAKPNKALFVALVGRSPFNYHRSEKRVGDKGLTAEGLKWFQARVSDEEDRALVGQLVTAMAKGGKVGDLNFNHKRTA